jgi:hypothetical protein
LRIAFLALLAGGLILWVQLRQPRDLRFDVDLSAASPGDVFEVEILVFRDGHALSRIEERYGPAGAPATVHAQVHARPGPVDLEITLVDARGTARRDRAEGFVLKRDAVPVLHF